jgi:hypothetical protein
MWKEVLLKEVFEYHGGKGFFVYRLIKKK